MKKLEKSKGMSSDFYIKEKTNYNFFKFLQIIHLIHIYLERNNKICSTIFIYNCIIQIFYFIFYLILRTCIDFKFERKEKNCIANLAFGNVLERFQ